MFLFSNVSLLTEDTEKGLPQRVDGGDNTVGSLVSVEGLGYAWKTAAHVSTQTVGT